MFFLVYKLFLQAGTAYYKVLIKQRNLNVNRQSVNIAMWCIRGDHIGDYIFIGLLGIGNYVHKVGIGDYR